jgi:hypothetical protein
MSHSGTHNPDSSPTHLVKIVETLEACGLPWDSYQLHDVVDVEALEQVLARSDGDIEVHVTIEGIRLAVTPSDVTVLPDDSTE